MSRIDELIAQLCPDGVEYKELREIGSVTRGGNFQKKHFVDQGIPCIHYGQIYTRYALHATETISFVSNETASKSKMAHPGDVVMAVTSENIEDVCKCVTWLGNCDAAISGHTAIIHHNQNPKYMTYFFHSACFDVQKRKLAHGTKVIEVTPDKLLDVKRPANGSPARDRARARLLRGAGGAKAPVCLLPRQVARLYRESPFHG